MNFGELSRSFVRKSRYYDDDKKRLDESLARLTLKIKEHEAGRINWVDGLVRPIARDLEVRFPDRTINVLGPFGIGARVSIHAYRRGCSEDEQFEEGNCLSIIFEPGDVSKGELRWVDYSRDTGLYARDSLGEANGLNHPAEPIPDDADVKWFVEHLK